MRSIRISKGLCIFTVLIMCIGLLWASVALANNEGGLPECKANSQTFPGDGYANPDSFGVSGHGPALSYTDNGNGTFTDNKTKFVWEKKLAADGSEGGNCQDTNQANRSVHCVNNSYTWTSTSSGTAPDGTLFTEFLAGLNNSAFAGFSDWCIPNIKKLQSIVDYSTFSPASSVPGATAASLSFYWSATTDANDPSIAWDVDFFGGNVFFNGKTFNFSARAVRPCS